MKSSTLINAVAATGILGISYCVPMFAKSYSKDQATAYVTIQDGAKSCKAPRLLATMLRRDHEGLLPTKDVYMQSTQFTRVTATMAWVDVAQHQPNPNMRMVCPTDVTSIWTRDLSCWQGDQSSNAVIVNRAGVRELETRINDHLSNGMRFFLDDLFSRSTCDDPIIFADGALLSDPNKAWTD